MGWGPVLPGLLLALALALLVLLFLQGLRATGKEEEAYPQPFVRDPRPSSSGERERERERERETSERRELERVLARQGGQGTHAARGTGARSLRDEGAAEPGWAVLGRLRSAWVARPLESRGSRPRREASCLLGVRGQGFRGGGGEGQGRGGGALRYRAPAWCAPAKAAAAAAQPRALSARAGERRLVGR